MGGVPPSRGGSPPYPQRLFFKSAHRGGTPSELFSELFYGVPHPTPTTQKAGGIRKRRGDVTRMGTPEHPIPIIFCGPPKKRFLVEIWRMAQSRRQVRPRSSRLVHSASFRARNPNKASITLMLAAAMIWATDALERHLAPPGFQCCERDLLGRSKPRD